MHRFLQRPCLKMNKKTLIVNDYFTEHGTVDILQFLKIFFRFLGIVLYSFQHCKVLYYLCFIT